MAATSGKHREEGEPGEPPGLTPNIVGLGTEGSSASALVEKPGSTPFFFLSYPDWIAIGTTSTWHRNVKTQLIKEYYKRTKIGDAEMLRLLRKVVGVFLEILVGKAVSELVTPEMAR